MNFISFILRIGSLSIIDINERNFEDGILVLLLKPIIMPTFFCLPNGTKTRQPFFSLDVQFLFNL